MEIACCSLGRRSAPPSHAHTHSFARPKFAGSDSDFCGDVSTRAPFPGLYGAVELDENFAHGQLASSSGSYARDRRASRGRRAPGCGQKKNPTASRDEPVLSTRCLVARSRPPVMICSPRPTCTESSESFSARQVEECLQQRRNKFTSSATRTHEVKAPDSFDWICVKSMRRLTGRRPTGSCLVSEPATQQTPAK